MKSVFLKLLTISLSVIFITVIVTEKSNANEPVNTITVVSNLSQTEIDGLILMREEEKLAHDVYTKLFEKWNIITFKNIAESENKHTTQIKYLLLFYGINDPYIEGIGRFSNPELQKTYNNLIEKGYKSKEDALLVGATIEDLDIADLNKLIKETSNTRILQVYENLNRGSRNHMRMFVNQIQLVGIKYSPQFITQNEFNVIVAGNMEKRNNGNINGNGKGNNKGMNNRGNRKKNNNKSAYGSNGSKGNCGQSGQRRGRGNGMRNNGAIGF